MDAENSRERRSISVRKLPLKRILKKKTGKLFMKKVESCKAEQNVRIRRLKIERETVYDENSRERAEILARRSQMDHSITN